MAGAVILSLSQNNPISQANLAKFKSDAQEINSELQLWISSKYLSERENFDYNSINVDNLNKKYDGKTITQILTTLKDDNINKFQIFGGRLIYVGNSIEEATALKEMSIERNLPYVKNGLVLWYDGVDNAGIGLHNDNSSQNNEIWKDLSGNDNDMTITEMNFSATDGWTGNSLNIDNIYHYIYSNNPLKDQTLTNQSYTVEVVFKRKSDGEHRYIDGINNGFHLTFGSSERGLMYINGGENDFYSYASSATVLNEVISYSTTYVKSDVINTVEMYTNGTDVVTNNDNWNSDELKVPAGMSTELDYSWIQDVELYSIRIYNRVLTSDEIQSNYDLDKVRYGI
jgi:hypothetical protein